MIWKKLLLYFLTTFLHEKFFYFWILIVFCFLILASYDADDVQFPIYTLS